MNRLWGHLLQAWMALCISRTFWICRKHWFSISPCSPHFSTKKQKRRAEGKVNLSFSLRNLLNFNSPTMCCLCFVGLVGRGQNGAEGLARPLCIVLLSSMYANIFFSERASKQGKRQAKPKNSKLRFILCY